MKISDLSDCLERGGAAILSHPATYAVPEGEIVAPARYSVPGGSGPRRSAFVFETRYVDAAFATTALIDSKQSQSNRSEAGLVTARGAGSPADLVPAMAVVYPSRRCLDAELPHRVFDAHIRAATHDGNPVVNTDWYRGIRDATHVDLSPLFIVSPVTLAFGGWDSTRKVGQLRIRSHYVSELFGVVAAEPDPVSKRSGARIDPLGQGCYVKPDEFEALLRGQQGDMSEQTVSKLEKASERARKKGELVSASGLGLGGVPPLLEAPYGVAVPEVRRVRTYSLAGLRRLRFGGAAADDKAARTALLAMLLLGSAYADADPEIRAYCDVAAPQDRVLLDGEIVDLDLSIESCCAFMKDAVAGLPERLAWTGQLVELVGDPALDRGAIDDIGAA